MTNNYARFTTQYRQDGYAWPVDVLSQREAAEHHQRLLDFEAANGPMHYRVKPYLLFSSAWELATHPVVLDAVEAVLGPDILLWDGAYIIKEPHTEGFISWHQDLTYWGLDSDSDDDVLTMWLALTPAMKINGCMQFVKGSHRGRRFSHEDTFDKNNLLHRGQSIAEDFSEEQITHLEMKAGQASLHHGWAVHASNPNRSDVRRAALAYSYIRPSVQQTVGQGETATLVRGVDNFNHFGAEPVCGKDNVAANVAFQNEVERKKHEVYDNA